MTLMQRAGHHVQSLSTTGPGSACEIAKCCLDSGADLILVAGGDGTINEVVNGMVFSPVPVAVLPGGTANVFAMDVGIGKSMIRAAQAVGDWIPERVSVGVHRDGPEHPPRYFLLMCGAGLDAHIVYHLSQPLKAALGKVSYWIGGFTQLGRSFPEFEVEAEGQRFRASFALASRVRNYGGDLEIAREVTLMEDTFELVLFSGTNSFRYLQYLTGVMFGKLKGTPGITILKTREVNLHAAEDERIYSQIDGEYAGPLPVRLSIVPRSLTLLLPQSYRAKRKVDIPQQEWTTSPTP